MQASSTASQATLEKISAELSLLRQQAPRCDSQEGSKPGPPLYPLDPLRLRISG